MERELVVRRGDIERVPPPAGGRFGEVALGKVALPSLITRGLGVFCVNTQDPVVAITYDDGPHPEDTPSILDELAARGATATFFVLGQQVERYPEVARRILAEGHEIGLHGFDHGSLRSMGSREAMTAVGDAKERIESLLSVELTSYRPPYGSHTRRQARRIRRLGMDVVLWSGDPCDWAHDDETRIAQRAVAALFPGSILLLHDNRGDPETLAPGQRLPAIDRRAVLTQILDGVTEHGYRTTTIRSLLSEHERVRSLVKERTAP